jgi:Holliday junction resolvasome RuvABC endonuclease subunit
MLHYGFDVGLRKVSVAVVTDTCQFRNAASYVGKSGEQRSRELRCLYQFVGELGIAPGDRVAVEAPVVAGPRNLRTSLQLAMSIGAVITAIDFLVNVQLVEPAKWKTITGNGHSTKSAIKDWLTELWPGLAKHCNGSQDLVDAMCIALWSIKAGNEYAELDDW